TVLREEVLTRRFQSGRALGMIRGNIELAAKLAAALEVGSPMLEATRTAWRNADAELGSGADHTAIIRWLESLPASKKAADTSERGEGGGGAEAPPLSGPWSGLVLAGVAQCLMPGRERAARAQIGGADHALRRDRDRVRGCARHVLHHLVAARFKPADHVGRQAALECDLVGQPLVMNAMGRDRLVDRGLQ